MNLRDLIKFVETGKIFLPDENIVLAVSGGIDSVVMAHMFAGAKFRFAIAHCNFGLRGADSESDAAFVRQLAGQLHVRCFTEKFDTAAIAVNKGISIQMAARDLRYDWFDRIRKENGFDHVATAHHLDDQVETFLINLIRGTGIAGLHGIPVRNGNIIRPMMFAFRKDIEEYALHHGISYRVDLSNNENKYLRNKIRHDLVPLICTLNPEFPHGLTESIRRIREFEQVGNRILEEWRRAHLRTDGDNRSVEIASLLSAGPVETYAWGILSPFGFNETQVSNLVTCLNSEARKIFISPTHRLVKERGQLVISPLKKRAGAKPVRIGPFIHKKHITKPLPVTFERITGAENYEIPSAGNTASLNFSKLLFPLALRKWQQGDAFYPLGMKKRKKLSDFFIDQKFSLKEKEDAWLLCSGKDIVWIIGHRIDHRYRVTPATREILLVTA
ncbi:MAG: tRNA lysidine(34) synthetase TilS [Bacteroidota bacterium]